MLRTYRVEILKLIPQQIISGVFVLWLLGLERCLMQPNYLIDFRFLEKLRYCKADMTQDFHIGLPSQKFIYSTP